MIRALALAALLAATMPLGATAQVGCLPPEEPYPYEPPQDDPELRAIISEDYQAYVLGVEDYLNCLHEETDRASAEACTVIERWVRHFGDEAVLRFRQDRAGGSEGD